MEWISVNDRLPDRGTAVLVCLKKRGERYQIGWIRNKWARNPVTDEYEITDELEWGPAANIKHREVTHWMPLPSLPR